PRITVDKFKVRLPVEDRGSPDRLAGFQGRASRRADPQAGSDGAAPRRPKNREIYLQKNPYGQVRPTDFSNLPGAGHRDQASGLRLGFWESWDLAVDVHEPDTGFITVAGGGVARSLTPPRWWSSGAPCLRGSPGGRVRRPRCRRLRVSHRVERAPRARA